MKRLAHHIISAVPGIRFAIHALPLALQHRLTNPTCQLPVMALRSSDSNYTKIRLFYRIELLGPSCLEPLFKDPLPGTAGRGVAILFTYFPLRVWLPERTKIKTIESEGRDPKEIMQEILRRFTPKEPINETPDGTIINLTQGFEHDTQNRLRGRSKSNKRLPSKSSATSR